MLRIVLNINKWWHDDAVEFFAPENLHSSTKVTPSALIERASSMNNRK